MRILAILTVIFTTLPLVLAGCLPAGEETQDSGTSLILMVLFLVGIFVVFYFLTIRPQRKRQKEHESLVQDLKKGEHIITAGGIYGQIESTSAESIVIKLESGATIRVARGSVVGKQENL